jgi:glutathione S-transferase
MKLFFAAASPFVRKCLVSAHELGLRERLELLPAAPHPVNRDRTLVASNPLGCALGYLDLRFASLEWREKYPDTAAWFEQFAKRESMAATRPPVA